MTLIKDIAGILQFDGSFPEKVLRKAVADRECVTPLFLSILNDISRNPERFLSDESYLGHLYAIFILARFREKAALKPLVSLFSLPDHITWELTGELVSEDLGRILASVSGGEIQPIQGIIENPECDGLFRAAGLDALLVLFVAEEISRESLVGYFRELYLKKLERSHSIIWDHLVVCSVNLYPDGLLDEINHAFDKGYADGGFVTLSEVKDALNTGKNEVLTWLKNNPDYHLITDAISEIRKWHPVTSE